VFNMGVGIALVVPRAKEKEFLSVAKDMVVFPMGDLVRA